MTAPNYSSKQVSHGGARYKMPIIGLAVLLSLAALLLVVLKLNNNGSTQNASAAAESSAEAVKLVIKSDEQQGKKGPDGAWHDAFLPADFSVEAGATVKVTVYNYDDMPHTFTAPGLEVNVEIPTGDESEPSKTTFTFHAPDKAGSYEWLCALPCDPYSMTHFGFMKGHVTVT